MQCVKHVHCALVPFGDCGLFEGTLIKSAVVVRAGGERQGSANALVSVVLPAHRLAMLVQRFSRTFTGVTLYHVTDEHSCRLCFT